MLVELGVIEFRPAQLDGIVEPYYHHPIENSG